MLRIKNEIDLKELEKFGFQKVEYEEIHKLHNYYRKLIYSDLDGNYLELSVNCLTRELSLVMETEYTSYNLKDVYELFETGFIEKV